ncbi:MAG: ATP-binding protein [Syntrophobacteraceae bacterium]
MVTKYTGNRATQLYLALVFFLLASGICLAGYSYYKGQKKLIKQSFSHELSAIGDLKAGELLAWRKERLSDALIIVQNRRSIEDIRSLVQNEINPRAAQAVKGWMLSYKQNQDYADILLLDPSGNVKLTTAETTAPLDGYLLNFVPEVIRERNPRFSELYRSDHASPAGLGLFAPVIDFGQSDQPIIGVLLFKIDTGKFLYPLIQKWPTASHSAETLVVARHGDEIVYLNEFRHGKSPFPRRFPLVTERLSGALAARGHEGVVDALDYRGLPVLAYLRHIPDSHWYMVAKIDKEEIFRPLQERVFLIVLVAALSITGVGIGLAFLWTIQKAQMHKKEGEVLRLARDELDRRVEERTSELVEANAVLKERTALLELSRDAIIVRDLEGRIIYWNKGAEQTYGWSREEAKGRLPRELLKSKYPIPLEDLESAVFSQGHWEGELIHVTRQNDVMVVESRWALQTNENGQPIAMLEINRDITSRKQADQALNDYAKKLERSNQVLQDFAFVASHDLQEPIRKIASFGSRLRSEYRDALGEEGLDYLERMRGATVRMQLLIESLLAYSRVTTKAEPFTSVDLDKIAKEVLLDLEIPIKETDALVEIGELPHIEADPNQISQLFQNVIGNAIKYHKTGERPIVKVHSKCEEGNCQIAVEDNGIGFDEKYLDRIFQPFQRLHGKSGPYAGSGMGLAICRKIVDRHNGTITATSKPGKGSTFVISLPIKQKTREWGQL